jgi:hypothetical protein
MPDVSVAILDDASLLRRIHPVHVVPDGNGRLRPSSGAFKDHNMSVDVEPMLISSGRNWTFSLRNTPLHWLVRLNAGHARTLSQEVIHRPLHDNDVHGEVVGKKTGSVSKAFRDAAEWVKRRD